MAINLMAIISIVFVIVIGAIVALFVLHFKKKPKSPAQVATNAEDISNLQTNVASLTKKIDWGPWSIQTYTDPKGENDEFQICYNNKVQLSVQKQDANTMYNPKDPRKGKPEYAGSNLWVQGLNSFSATTNRFGIPFTTGLPKRVLTGPPGSNYGTIWQTSGTNINGSFLDPKSIGKQHAYNPNPLERGEWGGTACGVKYSS
jgi:hypothetical protein